MMRTASILSVALVLMGMASGATGAAADSAQPAIDPKALGFEEILFVKRKPYSSDHYYTDINNGTSADRFVPDNGIYVYNLRT